MQNKKQFGKSVDSEYSNEKSIIVWFLISFNQKKNKQTHTNLLKKQQTNKQNKTCYFSCLGC